VSLPVDVRALHTTVCVFSEDGYHDIYVCLEENSGNLYMLVVDPAVGQIRVPVELVEKALKELK
jgi:hypothetical protein